MSLYNQQLGFAAGSMIVTPIQSGSLVTPERLGILQDITIDFKADVKLLYGQNRFAFAAAPGKTTIDMTAKTAGISGNLWNTTFFGATQVPAQTLFADNEVGTIGAGGTLTVANGTNFLSDEAVAYAGTGVAFTNVGTLTAAGQYQPPTGSPGTYHFDTADIGQEVYSSYLYSSAAGVQIQLANPKMGVGPSFRVVATGSFDGRQATYIFNNCFCADLNIPAKQDDWTITELKINAIADPYGNIGTINTSL